MPEREKLILERAEALGLRVKKTSANRYTVIDPAGSAGAGSTLDDLGELLDKFDPPRVSYF